MRIDAAASERVVGAALDAGINFFDTADIYGATKSEEFLGRALARRRRTRSSRRSSDGRAKNSLKRLGTDYIDLYQLHQPDAHRCRVPAREVEMKFTASGAVIVLLACSVPLSAQWTKFQDTSVPRTRRAAFAWTHRRRERPTAGPTCPATG